MDVDVVPYAPRYETELVRMWRASFERGVGVTDPHPIEAQVDYLNTVVLPENRVRLLIDRANGAVVGFLAATDDTIAELYIHVDYQRRGLGTRLLDLAKTESGGMLRLFTFERNRGARAFYERHGFRIVRRGLEEDWQLADLEYEWRR